MRQYIALILAALAVALTACGGGGTADQQTRVDDGTLEYKMWLWETEGGDPAKFTLDRFCHDQPEHCKT